MKKTLFVGILLSLMISCKDHTEKENTSNNFAIISGEIKNPNSNELNLYTTDGEKIKDISLNPEGKFTDTLKNVQGDYFILANENAYMPIYVENGDDIKINIDVLNPKQTLNYSGKGSQSGNYLAKKMEKENEFRAESRAIFSANETDFLSQVDKYQEELEKELEKVENKNFASKEKKDLYYATIYRKAAYEKYHGMLTGKPDFKTSDSYPKVMEEVSLDNEQDFKNSTYYRDLILNNFEELVSEKAKQKGETLQKVTLDEIEKLNPGIVKNAIILSMIDFLNEREKNNKSTFDKMVSLINSPEEKAKAEEKVALLTDLEPGNPSPEFVDLENYKGGSSSLEDFKGKFVYIDIWATWCGPCRQEIPYLKKLEEKYHSNKNLVFVSISVDTPKMKDKWRQMIKEKNMVGVQLLAGPENEFIEKYNVTGIPRFVLIGKEGEIISSDAPRPSQEKEIEALFQANGI